MTASIVTVSFNSEKTISKAIESVLNQTVVPVQYTIIDGKSSDNTVAVARSYEKAFADKGIDFKVISEKDNGIYDGMNKGIAMSYGDIVGMVNSDDWYEPIAIQKTIEKMEEDKADITYGNLYIHKSNGVMVKHAKLDKYPTTRHWNHPTMFVRKRVYENIHYANKTIYDDWDFFLRARKFGYKIAIIDDILSNFMFGGVSSRKNIKDVFSRINLKFKMYRQNGYSAFYFFDCFIIEVAKYILG